MYKKLSGKTHFKMSAIYPSATTGVAMIKNTENNKGVAKAKTRQAILIP